MSVTKDRYETIGTLVLDGVLLHRYNKEGPVRVGTPPPTFPITVLTPTARLVYKCKVTSPNLTPPPKKVDTSLVTTDPGRESEPTLYYLLHGTCAELSKFDKYLTTTI